MGFMPFYFCGIARGTAAIYNYIYIYISVVFMSFIFIQFQRALPPPPPSALRYPPTPPCYFWGV